MTHHEIEGFVNLLSPDLFRDFYAAIQKRLDNDARMQDAVCVDRLNSKEREIARTNKILAIKEVRARLGIGLKEAIAVLDKYYNENNIHPSFANKV